jgi:cellulose synthase operon protein C
MIDKLRVRAGGLASFLTVVVCTAFAWAGPVEDFDVAIKHYKNKKFDLATSSFADFIGKYPTHENRPLADLYYGQSLMQLRRFQDARIVFSEFLKANPNHTDFALAMYREAECAFFVNDLPNASKLFTAFLGRFPENDLSSWGWYYLGESQLRQNSPEKATEAFQTGLDKFPDSPRATETRFGLSRAYAALKNYDKAAEALRAIGDDEKNPRRADALFALGSLQFDAERYQEAAAAFDAVRLKFPEYRQAAEAALNAGTAYYKRGEYDKAVEAYDVASKTPATRLSARIWAGQARRTQEKFDQAIAINKAAYEEFKDNPDAAKLLYYWGDCEFRKGNAAAAVPLFLKFVDTYPTHDLADDSLHYAVDASLKAGDLARAQELHQRFTRDFPRSGLTVLESILYGRILLARAEEISPTSPNEEARKLLQSAAEVFDGVAKTSKVERTKAWATILLARAKSKLADWQGVIAAATPLNEKLADFEKPSEFAESLYLTGVAAAEQQQWALADASFEKYLKLVRDPKNVAAALSQLVLARTKAGKIADLESLWPQFKEAGVPADAMATALKAAAASALDAKQYPDAAKLYEQLESLPDARELRGAARSGLGYAKFYLEDFVGATEAFDRLLKDPPTDHPEFFSDAAFMKGRSLEVAKKGPEAAAAYLAGALLIAGKDGRVSDPPANPVAAWDAYKCIYAAATQYDALNDVVEADKAYAQASEYLRKLPAERQGDLDSLLYRWASANYRAKNYDRADKIFARLLQNHPTSSWADNATFYLTESMVLSGKALEAETELKKLLAAPSTDDAIRPEILHNLIELTAQRQGWADTQKFAKELIDRFATSPHRFNARYRLGEAALRLTDLDAARAVFAELREAVAKDASEVDSEIVEDVWIRSAETEIAASPAKHEEIDRLVDEFHKRFPEPKRGYQIDYVHARSLIRRAPPDVENARKVLLSVVESPTGKNTETAAQAHLRLADTYLLAQKAEEFPEAYRLFYYVAERYQEPVIQSAALYKAAEVQEKMEKRDGAIDTYRELLTRFPTSDEAEMARARLKMLGAETTPKPDDKPGAGAEPPKATSTTVPASDLPSPP